MRTHGSIAAWGLTKSEIGVKGGVIMRNHSFLTYTVLLIAGMLILNADVLSYDHPRSAVRFNFGVWDAADNEPGISVHYTGLGNHERLTDSYVSGLSGAFSISHMLERRFAWEFSMGGFVNGQSKTWSRRDDSVIVNYNTRNVFVSYAMVGLIYYPLYELDSARSNVLDDLASVFRPYLTVGIGPCFGWDTTWNEHDVTDTSFATATGKYAGVGLDLMLNRHLIFNVDLRYHFVEFNEPLEGSTDYSGPSVLAGFKIAL
jgi:hypothetical protein